MSKVKKTYRLDSNLVSELEEYAQAQNVSQTEALETAIRSAIQKPDASHTADEASSTDWRAMYLTEKQRSDDLTSKLLSLTDKVADSLQASQTLQAMDRPILESSVQKKRRWDRLKEAWRG